MGNPHSLSVVNLDVSGRANIGPLGFQWDPTDANANEVILDLPLGNSTNVPVVVLGQGIGGVDLGLYNGVTEPRIALLGAGAVTTGPVLEFRKARGTAASPTVVTSGDDIGTIDFYGAVATGEYVRGASIRADMTGTIATTRGPTTLTFLTASDAAPSVLSSVLVLNADRTSTFMSHVHLGDGLATFWGGADDVALLFATPDANANALFLNLPAGSGTNVPVMVINNGAASAVDLGFYNGIVDPKVALLAAGAVTTGPTLEFRKARGTIASPTVVTTGDDIGQIMAYGAVAAGEYVQAASIEFDMAGTIATTRGPGTVTIKTATDAAPSVLTAALTIGANQSTIFGGRIVETLANTDVDAQNNTLTIAQIAGGIVTHTSITGGGTVTTDTAANIIAGSGAAPALTVNGQTIKCYYVNDGTQTLTFAGGDSVTVSDTGNTVLADESVILLFRRTAAGTVTMDILGS